jgi:cytidine deaminase
VDIDVMSGMGFCAEHSAIAAMITNGEFRIQKIVAVFKDDQGSIFVLSPCGRCQAFMLAIDAGNLDTDVILEPDHVVKLSELIPKHDWFYKI